MATHARTILLLTLAALLGCRAPSFRVEGWGRRTRPACWTAHDNGVWEVHNCRRGRGLMAWADWTM